MKIKRKLILISFVAAFTIFVAIGLASADAPWTLYGNANADKVGAKPNQWAIKLVSDCCNPNEKYGLVNFNPPKKITFDDIVQLSTDYLIEKDDDCYGGSPRFQINIDMNDNGIWDTDGSDRNVFVYIGPYPNYTGCEQEKWISTGNLINATDKRFDTTQVGGTFYDSHEHASELVGDKTVLGIQLVVDSCWGFIDNEQTIWVDNIQVNNHKLIANAAK